MPIHDLYLEYLGNLSREELAIMAQQQGVTRAVRKTKADLVIELIDKKIQQAEQAVIQRAREWHQDRHRTSELSFAIVNLESLHESRAGWEAKQ